ncbi:MAG TPA: serine hydrolase domain-containing protein, partial [Longimicrobiaceae bacterium]|nr:serine hydrolase domain-containing protein [Longimicrobiaceae bacterium]
TLAAAGCAAQGLAAQQAAADSLGRELGAVADSLLVRTGIAGAAVAVVRGGELVHVSGHGDADRFARLPVTSATVFNAGSIAKSVTAWGVMRLVEAGRLDLDAPAGRYLTRWRLPPSPWGDSAVTIRRLLGHTAGISHPSVRELPWRFGRQDAAEALTGDREPVHQADPPGEYRYSGGGYAVLQLVVEEVVGRPFADYVSSEVLAPLGMRSSTMGPPFDRLGRVAQPYDAGRPVTLHRYAGDAAAGLYTTAEDLGRFAAAHVRGPNGEPPGRGVLAPATVSLMLGANQAAAPAGGARYGLGYSIFPTETGGGRGWSMGHMGQNTGWAGVFWVHPPTGDGVVVLTNDSRGMELHRRVLCRWAERVARPWRGPLCEGEPARVAGAAAPGGSRAGRDSAAAVFADSLLRAYFPADGPGIAVGVARDGREVFSRQYGLADLATRRPIDAATPFYLASVSKPLTALAVQLLVRDGRLRYDDSVARLLPELAGIDPRITVHHLLAHTSGLRDYYEHVDFSSFRGLSDSSVLALVRAHPEVRFAPGSRFDYTNTEYALLSRIVARRSGRPLSEFLARRVFEPLGMGGTLVYDDTTRDISRRARGYSRHGRRFLLADQDVLELPDGSRMSFAITATGAGGVFSTVGDLLRLDAALSGTDLLGASEQETAFRVHARPEDQYGIPRVEGAGYGWFVSERYGTRVLWHDGSHGGRRGIWVRVPAHGLGIVMLSNDGQTDLVNLATTLADRFVGDAPPPP